MQPQESEIYDEDADADEIRHSVHDVAAAIISVRALAETLAEHVPTLVAMSRSKNLAKQAHLPATTLDSLPAIPAEIVKLCEIAREALQAVGQESRPNQGASTDPARAPIRSATAWTHNSQETSDLKHAEVLLVEDDEKLRYILLQRLQAQGCRVTSSSHGEEALSLIDKTHFDLVLMDLRLPGVSGWETTKRLRERELAQGRHTRIVGLTASPMMQDHVRAKAAGMDEVLVKPIDNLALRSVLKRLT